MSTIIDFCIKWNQLSELKQIRNINTFHDEVRWGKWDKRSRFSYYTKVFYGHAIKQTYDSENNSEDSEKEEIPNAVLQNDEVKQIIECLVWHNSIDIDVNLQWLSCSKTFCFDWLMRWMLERSSCPNWRTALTKSGIHPNKEWKKFIEILMKIPKYPQWKEHNEEATLYWKNWSLDVCSDWIINKKHDNHELMTNKERSNILHKEIEQKLSTNNIINDIDSTYNNVVTLKEYWYLKEQISKDALESLYQSINEAWKEINFETNEFLTNYVDSAKNTQKYLKKNKAWMTKFLDSNDPSLITEASIALEKIDDLSSGLSRKLEEGFEKLEGSDQFWFNHKLIEGKFSMLLSKLIQKAHKFIPLKKESEECLVLMLLRSEVNQINIFANFVEKYKSKWYMKLELEENKFCKLASNDIKEYDFTQDGVLINVLKINSITNIPKNAKIKLKLLSWKSGDCTEVIKKKVLISFLNKTLKEIDKKENILPDNSQKIVNNVKLEIYEENKQSFALDKDRSKEVTNSSGEKNEYLNSNDNEGQNEIIRTDISEEQNFSEGIVYAELLSEYEKNDYTENYNESQKYIKSEENNKNEDKDDACKQRKHKDSNISD